jgi:phosphoribosyl 1,2-cyclic phosphodiesterase
VRYGGNTACVEVRGRDGALIILDAGTGIRRLGGTLDGEGRIDILLSHLHTDHIQGLGFFAPIFQPGRDIHIWGPPSTTMGLRQRLTRYLSAPLFPVHLRELPSRLSIHDTPRGAFEIEGIEIRADLILHAGPTAGYRLSEDGATAVYLSDHEPALGSTDIPTAAAWTSGYVLAEGADVLVHDCQYTASEYPAHVGWGHSSFAQALEFASQTRVKRLVTFHHDPGHSDEALDAMHAEARQQANGFELVAGVEGLTIEVGNQVAM